MKQLFLFLIFTFSFANAQETKETLTLNYGINESNLTNKNQSKINNFIQKKKVVKVEIVGYTDYLGTSEKNLILSQNRANKASTYIKGKGLNVVSVNGKGVTGETLEGSTGILKNRRVEITFHFKTIEKKEEEKEIVVEEKKEEKEVLQEEILNLEVGEKLVLKNFNFIPGRHFLLAESKPELSRLIEIMQKNKTLKIELHGHICCEIVKLDGWDIDNMNYTLSKNRAQYIYQQLIKFGIAADRISFKGFGRTQPLYPDELNENQKNANRRVEILIVEK